jgi:hypothetical protein
MTRRHETLFILLVPLAACAGKTVDVGQDEEGATGINERSDPAECEAIATERAQARAEALTPTLSETPAHTGLWIGSIENGQFPSGSDQVSLVLFPDGSGTVLFGEEGALAAELRDPEAVDPMIIGAYPGYVAYAGYPYTLYHVEAIGDRLRFQIRTAEPWSPWCRAQPSYAWDDCGYNCVQQAAGGGEWLQDGCFIVGAPNDPSTRQEVSCSVFALCFSGSACECTAESCDFNAGYSSSFDGTLTDGATAIRGRFAGGGTTYLVRK